MIPLVLLGIVFLLGLSFVIFSKQFVKRMHNLRLKNNRRNNKGFMSGNPDSDRIQIIFGGLVLMVLGGYYFYQYLLEYLI